MIEGGDRTSFLELSSDKIQMYSFQQQKSLHFIGGNWGLGEEGHSTQGERAREKGPGSQSDALPPPILLTVWTLSCHPHGPWWGHSTTLKSKLTHWQPLLLGPCHLCKVYPHGTEGQTSGRGLAKVSWSPVRDRKQLSGFLCLRTEAFKELVSCYSPLVFARPAFLILVPSL